MSLDADGHQRRWLALGYGGKTASSETWRYWKVADRHWTVSAPHGLAEFDQRHRTVFFRGEELFTAATQWDATWRALAYFYGEVVPGLPAPPKT